MVFFLKKIGMSLLLITTVIFFNFSLIHLAPGDPAETIAGEMGGTTPEILAEIRHKYLLDRPFHEQFAAYFLRIAGGDLGESYFFNTPVADLILDKVAPTLLLVISSLFLSFFLGTFFGVLSSLNPRGIKSNLVTVFSLLGFSMPVFWSGLLLLILFSYVVPIFPVEGMGNPDASAGWLDKTLGTLHHLFLPCITLSLVYLAYYSRLARSGMLDTLKEDFIRTARSKGLSENTVIYKHALRNAILPVITFAGLQFSQLFAGAILVESVYNWPGLGTLAFDSILRRDHPTLLGILFFSTVIVILVNLATDVVYRILDPRIRQ